MKHAFFLFLLFLSLPLMLSGVEKDVVFSEHFDEIRNWEPLYFPKIHAHSLYEIKKENGESYLQATSHASASGLIYKETFNVYQFPLVEWKWKVSNIYAKGDATRKEGDDYPLRIYIIFQYDPARATLVQRVKYAAAKILYGRYPPAAALNYIWANKEHAVDVIPNAYTPEAKMILLQKGTKNVGSWHVERVNIREDYTRVFGGDPPATASLAIMNDSDNTGESSVSYIDYIEVFREP